MVTRPMETKYGVSRGELERELKFPAWWPGRTSQRRQLGSKHCNLPCPPLCLHSVYQCSVNIC